MHICLSSILSHNFFFFFATSLVFGSLLIFTVKRVRLYFDVSLVSLIIRRCAIYFHVDCYLIAS